MESNCNWCRTTFFSFLLYTILLTFGFLWTGKNYINAKNFLERRYSDDIELDDAVHIALLTLRESYEGEMTENNIEVAIVGTLTKRQFLCQ